MIVFFTFYDRMPPNLLFHLNHEFETIIHMFDETILTHLESGGEYRRIEASVAWPSGLRRWI